jgi:hypothetical protein
MQIFRVKPTPYEVEHAGLIRQGVLYQQSHQGDLPGTPFWNMIERRYLARPLNFQHYHPNLFLMEMTAHHATPERHVPHGWIGHMRQPPIGDVCPPIVECPPPVGPPAQQVVPEPVSCVLLLIGLIGCAYLKIWSKG